MTYDIHYHIRLIDAHEYKLDSFDALRGFISGLYAGNYDISQVFIDNLCNHRPLRVRARDRAVPRLARCVLERATASSSPSPSAEIQSLATEGMIQVSSEIAVQNS
jgi:hypothetical protein